MKKPIIIGDHCWICTGSKILKGTELPADTIVGAMSFCSKKYETPQFSFIAGVPAKLKKSNISHVR